MRQAHIPVSVPGPCQDWHTMSPEAQDRYGNLCARHMAGLNQPGEQALKALPEQQKERKLCKRLQCLAGSNP